MSVTRLAHQVAPLCRRVRSALALLLLVAVASVPPAALAQVGTPPPGRFCLRNRPAAGCSWFPITEFGVAILRPATEAPTRFWSLGLLHPVAGRWALGGSLVASSSNGPRTALTLAPVGRLALTRSLSLNLAPGLVFHGQQARDFPAEQPSPDTMITSRAEARAPAFAMDASLNLGDWATLFFHTSVFRYSTVSRYPSVLTVLPGGGTTWLSLPTETVAQPGTIVRQWIGVRAGSYPGLALGAAAVLVTMLVKGAVND